MLMAAWILVWGSMSAAARAAKYVLHDEICFHGDYRQAGSELCLKLMLIQFPKAHNVLLLQWRKDKIQV